MAEPTTPNKGFTVPNTGDLSNAWGPVINTNFTNIDTALAGSQSIALTSGGTVTMTSAQSQFLTTTLTGALSAASIFALPAVGGFYLINNTTTGSQTVTCQVTGAPGATITLGAGWTTVFTDGTNCYQVAPTTYLNAPSGTRMLFQQSTAPTGWTQSTTYNDYALRLVSGTPSTGGTIAFSTAFSASNTVDGHSVTQAELPACSFPVTDPKHSHTFDNGAADVPVNVAGSALNTGGTPQSAAISATDSASTGITVSSGGSGTPHDHTLSNLAVKYIDVVICQKD